MVRPKDVLSKDDLANYRNVRAVSVLFAVFGSILTLGGILVTVAPDPNAPEQVPPIAGIIIGIVGFAGAIGGIAALKGSRRWAPLVYVMASLYVLAFPVGTILSVVMFSGLSRYLDSKERIKAASETET